jgi:hypothetical protein
MFQAYSRNSPKTVILSLASSPDDFSGHHPHDLQGLPHRRRGHLRLHTSIPDCDDDEPKSKKAEQARFLNSQNRANLHHNRAHDK